MNKELIEQCEKEAERPLDMTHNLRAMNDLAIKLNLLLRAQAEILKAGP